MSQTSRLEHLRWQQPCRPCLELQMRPPYRGGAVSGGLMVVQRGLRASTGVEGMEGVEGRGRSSCSVVQLAATAALDWTAWPHMSAWLVRPLAWNFQSSVHPSLLLLHIIWKTTNPDQTWPTRLCCFNCRSWGFAIT